MSLYGGIKFSSAPGSSSSQLQRSLDSENTKSAPSPASASASAPGPSSISAAAASQDARSTGSTSKSALAPAATGGFSAALKFAPRIRQPKAVSAPRSAPTYSASATIIESQPVLLQSKNDEIVMGADGRPLAAAPSMTLKDKTKDVSAAKRIRDGDATRKKKKKKKKRFEMPSMVVSMFDPDEPYDPNRPNDLGEYRAYRKRLREEKRAKALAERERRARGESSESGSSYYSSSEEEAPRRDAPKMFAPPKMYSPPRASANLPPAQAQPAKRDESGEDAYARRAALAQAATGDDAYARRVAMSQAATGDDAYARRAAMSVRPPSDPQPPPPPPPAAMPDFPPPPPPALTVRPPFVPPPANALAGAPPPPPPSTFVPPPFAALAGAPRPPPSMPFVPQSPAPDVALSEFNHGSRSLPEPPTQSSSSHQQPEPASEEFDRMLAERKAAAAAIAAKFAALTSKPALPSLDEVEGKTWAEKHLRRFGHKEGEMLGTSGSGIIHALSTEHVVAPPKPTDPSQPLSKRQLAKQRAAAANAKNQNRRWVQHATNRGRIVNANEDERIKEEKDRVGEASRIVCLVGVVDSVDDVDEDLTGEIGEECSKYGIVERVLLHVVEPPPEEAFEGLRVFVVFSGMAGAWRAIKELDGRFFGGKKIRARYFDESKFDKNDRDGELA